MTIIEEAAKRLEQLERAGIHRTSPPGPAREAETTRLQPGVQAGEPRANASPNQYAHEGLSSLGRFSHAPARPQIELDLARIAERGIVTPDAPRTRTADEIRVIKRSVLANATLQGQQAIRNGNLVIITSALPGEGKSFIAVNLAMSIAMELGRTVLLVDADVSRPSVPDILGFEAARGLLDLLVDPSLSLGDVLLRTNVDKLSILSSGTKHTRATELLASETMHGLLDEMAQRYSDRIIVFDSPPLLITTEAQVLAAHMGQIILVVEADRTPQSVVKHALAALDQRPVKLMLLNKARRNMHDSYRYHYGDGHGS
jgi:receptor protein-tyrosine kinase